MLMEQIELEEIYDEQEQMLRCQSLNELINENDHDNYSEQYNIIGIPESED